ncbi:MULTISPECIES: isochorismatase family protein [Myxococcus]|uniref:isochorismatase n=1 Tax=Myxococcus xanthus TaxID=34 RepID=A0AAE6G0M1_MYXXA|nr:MULTISPECIES: isochorismatase family protein [Myxococcus]QDE68704.1 isochorismatase [Myxococcus xanthus]QDE75980.1 isochorismatase [Myxococcus xanthus]WAM30080.1 isochorismatase family protein [Myxococcus sp. NMCA1]
MALPAIAPYPMPGAADLPKNKVTWTPDPSRTVLLIHDMQRYFVEAFAQGQSPVTELVANIQRLRQHCTALGIPVVYSAQPGGQTPEQRGLLLDFWGGGINGGPDQKRIIDALTPAEGEIQLTKWRYSAFRKTDLMEQMKKLGRDQILISGIYAHIGCLQTASDAFMSDVRPFLIADALGDFSLAHHQLALSYAAQLCAVTTTTQQVLEALGPVATASTLTREQVRAEVAELLQESPEALGDDDNLLDRGMDSIRLMTLVEKWRAAGAETTFVELAERPTLADWFTLLSLGNTPASRNAA